MHQKLLHRILTRRLLKTRNKLKNGQFFLFKAAAEKIPATPPVFIYNAYCDVASDYHKKKNVLRLKSADNAESLLEAASASDMKEWIAKVNHYAGI